MTIRVAALVTLHRHPDAGGHVKCWERLAEAASGLENRLDLDVYFLGRSGREIRAADNVRIVELPPRWGTERWSPLSTGAGDTDLAPFRWDLARRLRGADLIHVTDTFAFGKTGRAMAARMGRPLTYSIQTDLPRFTVDYGREVLARALPKGLARFATDRLRVPERAAAINARAVRAMVNAADHVFTSNESARRALERERGPGHVSLMRRGLDERRFHPRRRDRAWLAARFGVPAERTVLLFVGRLDASKRVMTAAHVVRALVDEGLDVTLFLAGEGRDRDHLTAMLGDRAVVPGPLDQDTLGRVYASSDLFLFPSESETRGMVALEAKASGLPVVVRAGQPPAEAVACSGADGVVVEASDPGAWVEACRPLVVDGALRAAIGRAARDWATAWVPSWAEVLKADLLRPWERLCGRSLSPRQGPGDGPREPPGDKGAAALKPET